MPIREANINDLERIREIYIPYIVNTAISFEYIPPSSDEFIKRYNNISGQFPWLVYETDGIIAGYAYASKAFERAAYSWDADLSIYIDEKYHRKGIGRSLYSAIENILLIQGYYNIYAIVSDLNENSRVFHKSMGYTEIAHFDDIGFKFGKWHSLTWFRKILPHDGDPTEMPVSWEKLKSRYQFPNA